jgi:hypothetical protein
MQKGNLCTVSFTLTTASFTFTTASGQLLVTGFPVLSSTATAVYEGPLIFNGITKATYTNFVCRKDLNSALVNFQASGSGVGAAFVVAADTPSAGTLTLNGTITYEVAP